MNEYKNTIRRGEVFQPLYEPTVIAAIKALRLDEGSGGLDAGCGIGLQTRLLAAEVGKTGHVTGLDINPKLLENASLRAKKSGIAKQVAFQKGDVRSLPFAEDTFDWAWSANLVGYAPIRPLPLIEEMARVVKPGGMVAIFAWSSEHLLPGFPALEACLGATPPGLAPFF